MSDQAKNLRKKIGKSSLEEAKTIAFISGKGGVGKSNLAVNFSLELIKKNKKVIIFDLDLGMGNVNILLGLQPKYTIVDLFKKQVSISDVIEEGPGGLAYIAGGSGLSHFVEMDVEKKELFYNAFEKVAKAYDYIIFDMGAGVTPNSLFFILAADECMVVTTGEPTAITDAYSMIKQVIVSGGTMPIRLILNRANSKEEIALLTRLQQVVKQFLKADVYPLGFIPEDRAVIEAVGRQMPYSLLNERSKAAKSVKQLVHHYLHDSSKMVLTYQPSFLSKLKQLIRGNF
jgi:flagellar biosynthesis protein FlhG